MTVTGVTDCAILAIRALLLFGCYWLRLRLYLPPGKPPAEASCCGAAAGVVSGLFGRSSRGTASEICHLWVPRGGDGSGSYCCGARVCPCKQLTHRHQIIVVVGNDDRGGK
jgi:hypothetical protein